MPSTHPIEYSSSPRVLVPAPCSPTQCYKTAMLLLILSFDSALPVPFPPACFPAPATRCKRSIAPRCVSLPAPEDGSLATRRRRARSKPPRRRPSTCLGRGFQRLVVGGQIVKAWYQERFRKTYTSQIIKRAHHCRRMARHKKVQIYHAFFGAQHSSADFSIPLWVMPVH